MVDTNLRRSEKKDKQILIEEGKKFKENMEKKGIKTDVVIGSLEKIVREKEKKIKANLIIIGREQKKPRILGDYRRNPKLKIAEKTKLKGKTQLNLSEGNNIVVDKDDYKTADTLVLAVPKNTIKKTIKFQKNALIYLTGGKHVGDVGTIDDIKLNKITYKLGKGVYETLKKYAFVIGEDKPVIKIKNESNENH